MVTTKKVSLQRCKSSDIHTGKPLVIAVSSDQPAESLVSPRSPLLCSLNSLVATGDPQAVVGVSLRISNLSAFIK